MTMTSPTWTIGEPGEKTTIAGRPCRQVVASGDADYAEAEKL